MDYSPRRQPWVRCIPLSRPPSPAPGRGVSLSPELAPWAKVFRPFGPDSGGLSQPRCDRLPRNSAHGYSAIDSPG